MTECIELTTQQREILMETTCKGAKAEDFLYMLELAKLYQLDPFARQIYCTKAGIIVGRDGYLTLAHRSGHFAGIETTFVEGRDGTPISSTTTVWRDDKPHPFVVTCHWNEYYKPGVAWDKYKHAMMRKCSEKEALKLAFNLTGLYTSAEMESTLEIEEKDAAIHAPDYCTGHTVIDVEPEPQPEQTKPADDVCPKCGKPSMLADERSRMQSAYDAAGYGTVPENYCKECANTLWKVKSGFIKK